MQINEAESEVMDLKSVLRVCFQTAFAFAVVFTGWGWDDLGGFFSHPARAGLVLVGFLSLFFVLTLRVPLDMLRKGRGPSGGSVGCWPVCSCSA